MSDHITTVTIRIDDLVRDVPDVQQRSTGGPFVISLGVGATIEGSAESIRKLALSILSDLPCSKDAGDLERARLFLLRTVDHYSTDSDTIDALQLLVNLVESAVSA